MIRSILLSLSLGLFVGAAAAVTCFFKYEHVSGMNKICVYDMLGSDVAITIKAYQLCPQTINR
jgi:hypothetical protein